MNITSIALKNAQFVLIILLIAVVIGIRSFISMPRSEDPQVDFPIYNILIVYPGTSPEDMETLVVDPIEEVLNEIDDLTRVVSDIREGVAIIAIDGAYGISTKDKYDDILREINRIRGDLPAGIVQFVVQQIKPEDRVNFTLFALSSEAASYANLENYAEELEEQLESIDGISDISIEAAPKEEIRISIDYERMAAQHLSLQQVIGILQTNNINIPGGEISSDDKYFTIKSTGGYKRLAELQNSIIGGSPRGVVYLKDIADVSLTHEDIRWIAKFEKTKSVYIALKLKRGYNILDVDKQVQQVATDFSKQLPNTIKLNTAFEQASAVEKRINDFFLNLLQGVALVGVIIFLFLGWRASIIIITLIPLCVILALAILNGAGYGLQQISVASLVLALGLLVDNGIVVIENITRFIRQGFSRGEAAFRGASEVSMAIASSTVTTLLSFFPLTQLGEGAGLYLKSLPLTVVFTLIISLILALSFSPILSKWVLSEKQVKATRADLFFDRIADQLYKPLLQFALKKGWLIMLIAVVLTGFSISLFPKIGVSFFPTADKPLLLVDIEAPDGSSLAYTAQATAYVESIIDTMDIVKDYTSNVGNGSPQIYYNRIPTRFRKENGQLLINLKKWEPESFYKTIAYLRKAFENYPGAKITVEELKNGAPVPAPIEIRIYGENLNTLKSLTAQVESIFENTEGVINIVNPLKLNRTEIKFNLDRQKAGMLNVSELAFNQTVRASLNGLQIDNITIGDDTYPVVVRMPIDNNAKIEDFDRLYIANRQGTPIPLRHIANIEFSDSPASFSHLDQNRYVAVKGSLVNLDNTIGTTTAMIPALDEIDWPKGYRYEIGGEYEEQQSTFGSLGIILLLAQVAIFAVLVLQFRSITQPFIVFSAIPLAISGAFIALYLTGWPFSFFAFVGLISLIGIVVNNSIILVDYSNQLQAEGQSKLDAIINGSATRLKPIILTTFTTILGLVPLTLQGTNQWSPLCWTIIGGVISSTLLTLIVVPILYKWFSRERASINPV